MLINETDLDLKTVVLLDRIQKKEAIDREDAARLKRLKLIEGRYPNIYVAAPVAIATDKRAEYIRNRPFDDEYYKKLIVGYIKKFPSATRENIDKLLWDKLSDVLDGRQKKNKIRNLLASLSTKDKVIKNAGPRKKSKWVLRQDKG